MTKIKGKIEALNISPKGFYESVLVKQGKQIVQVNLRKNADPAMLMDLKPGANVTFEAEEIEDDRPSDHPVYEWTGDSANEMRGTIARINYARHGEPNGVVLDNGIFVHTRPDGAKRAKFKLGKKITVEGDRKTSEAGFTVIEARMIDGIDLKAKKPKK